ncbi:13518_t:CDS:2 [Cetraspora pellucida]|uniref:13518_t:CDS:1 n=1 Tax=Cetraspora pellucida TaxID=1433469 RepID=A0A9N9DSQ7_9GLOM|nr:13518_t:CDS:2 [Cetraspora pellucida]
MPKYYCDYCDVYLTHDSSSVRKAHNNEKTELGQDKAQAIIDEITKAYECVGQAGFPPQYGYIPGIIPVAPIVNPPPYAAPVHPPLMMARPPVGTGNMPTSLSPPGALPPPGGSASFNAPGLPPQFPPGQPPRGVKRQMEE